MKAVRSDVAGDDRLLREQPRRARTILDLVDHAGCPGAP